MTLPKIVPDLHKQWSMYLTTAIIAVGSLAEVLPELKHLLPDNWYIPMAALVIVARALQHPKPKDSDDEQSGTK